MEAPPIQHDVALFDALSRKAREIDPAVRVGAMFGCPAVYVGRKLAACVYGDAIGLKTPAAIASLARGVGRADPFTPYGKAPMREWIRLAVKPDGLDEIGDLLAAAIDYARANHA